MDYELDIKEEPILVEEPSETLAAGILAEGSPRDVLQDVDIKQEITAVVLPKVEEEEAQEKPGSPATKEQVLEDLKEEADSQGNVFSEPHLNVVQTSSLSISAELQTTNSVKMKITDTKEQSTPSVRSADLWEVISVPYQGKWCCHFCRKGFDKEALLEEHLSIHEGENKPSVLPDCGEDPIALTSLYSCGLCSETSFNHEEIMNHLRTHTEEERHICNICNKEFPRHSNLQWHLRSHNEKEHFSCTVCGKIYNSVLSLNQHEKCHNDVRKHSCTICRKSFVKRRHLRQHVSRHTGGKPYSCSVCGKSYTDRRSLNRHKVVHSDNQKPYSCNICSKTFADLSNCKVHARVHTGEKPYSCKTCGKLFAYSSRLKTHVLSHSKK